MNDVALYPCDGCGTDRRIVAGDVEKCDGCGLPGFSLMVGQAEFVTAMNRLTAVDVLKAEENGEDIQAALRDTPLERLDNWQPWQTERLKLEAEAAGVKVNNLVVSARKRKHGNRLVFLHIEGEQKRMKFDSVGEFRYWLTLLLRQADGEISGLVFQPVFVLQEGFTVEDEKVSKITYRADFQYIEDGKTVTVDVKGHRTAAFNLKRKMFMKKFNQKLTLVKLGK